MKLVDLFSKRFALFDFPGVRSDLVLQLVYAYCRGPMAELLARTTRQGLTLDSFYAEALDAFLPGRLRELLFYRVQAHGEGLALFVGSIRDAARVLRIPMAEQEVVQVILEGVTPQERSRLVFAERPRSFADLDRFYMMSPPSTP